MQFDSTFRVTSYSTTVLKSWKLKHLERIPEAKASRLPETATACRHWQGCPSATAMAGPPPPFSPPDREIKPVAPHWLVQIQIKPITHLGEEHSGRNTYSFFLLF